MPVKISNIAGIPVFDTEILRVTVSISDECWNAEGKQL
jgi:hypothetical protein